MPWRPSLCRESGEGSEEKRDFVRERLCTRERERWREKEIREIERAYNAKHFKRKTIEIAPIEQKPVVEQVRDGFLVTEELKHQNEEEECQSIRVVLRA